MWDMANTKTGERKGLVRVYNIGRRPVFISIVALELPKGSPHDFLVIAKSLSGTNVEEGSAPLGPFVPDDGRLEPYKSVWRKIRAYAEDSAGKKYRSAYPAKDAKTPPWAA